jgi:hypothetical protein
VVTTGLLFSTRCDIRSIIGQPAARHIPQVRHTGYCFRVDSGLCVRGASNGESLIWAFSCLVATSECSVPLRYDAASLFATIDA